MEALGLLTLGIELLAGPVEVIDHRQDLAEGAAGDLDAEIVLVPALALAEVVEIGGDPHVLLLHALVFRAQGGQLGLKGLEAVCGR
jgi:hypothetical protein